MCILLIYSGLKDAESDYSYILVANRDEFYSRPAKNMGPWSEDLSVYGGRDLEVGCEGGTWLAYSPIRKKIGVLLNLPGAKKENAKSRGKIVADFVKCEQSTSDYVECMSEYFKKCNDFIFVTVELSNYIKTLSYNNVTCNIDNWSEQSLGFSNSLPHEPLKKVETAKSRLLEICNRKKKINEKAELIEELINLLKSKEQYLPDIQLEKRQPTMYKQLSSIFVEIPEGGYGTRTHTMILVTKTGHIDAIEITLQSPINLSDPHWQKTEFQFDI